MKIFAELADGIEERWRAAGYDQQVFPRLAAEGLAEARLPDLVTPWEILKEVGQADQLTDQRDLAADFSNLPLTLVNRPRFYIDLYLWLDGTTMIHQHSFSGAFQVLAGSSLHSRYNFTERHRVNEHFRIGDVGLDSVELLDQGDFREIPTGTEFAHSLFHLARPSATITVRTFADEPSAPQLDYLPPTVANDPFFHTPGLTRRLQIASFLLESGHAHADGMIRELLAISDLHTSFLILAKVNQQLRQVGLERVFAPDVAAKRLGKAMAAAWEFHGDVIDEFAPVFFRQNLTAEIVRRRAQVTSDEHRFFLALLLNLPDRDRVLEMIRARYPDADPIEQILEWVGELGRTRVWNSPEPNVLGLPEFDEDYLFVLEQMLKGNSADQIEAAVDEEYSAEQAGLLKPKVRARCEELRRLPLVRELLKQK
jgi:hypothetical protein